MEAEKEHMCAAKGEKEEEGGLEMLKTATAALFPSFLPSVRPSVQSPD